MTLILWVLALVLALLCLLDDRIYRASGTRQENSKLLEFMKARFGGWKRMRMDK